MRQKRKATKLIDTRRSFDLNTAISGLDADGTWDEVVHKAMVMPVRRQIMQHDGLTGCFIGRYHIQVDYLVSVVDFETVVHIVQNAVTWAADQEGLFPLRGDKTPAVIPPEEKKQPDTSGEPRWAYANFSSHLTFYPADADGFDSAAFWATTDVLRSRLTDHDGIVGYKLWLSQAGLRFDPTITSYEDVVAHMTHVLTDAAAQGFFPFLQGVPPVLDFFMK